MKACTLPVRLLLALTALPARPASPQTTLSSRPADAAELPGAIVLFRTPSGVEYGVLGERPPRPAPTLFLFAGTMKLSLGDTYYRQCGGELARRGYICVSVDLPSHGADRRPGEPEGLVGWRWRVDRGMMLFADLNRRLTDVLEHLIARGYTDPQRVAACGISRGGFVALHFAASEPRIACVAAFCPVTDLDALTEFQGSDSASAVHELSLRNQASKLAGRPVWMVIGDRDQRVGTDLAIAFARHVSAESMRLGRAGRLELHIMPEPRGHTVPEGSFRRAAEWIETVMGAGAPKPEGSGAGDH